MLNANVMADSDDDDDDDARSSFATCALRFPGIYGSDDPLMVGPFLDGGVDSVPAGSAAATMDVIYVENAAHAHCLAVEGLLNNPDVFSKRTFNVTNDDPESSVKTFNKMLKIFYDDES